MFTVEHFVDYIYDNVQFVRRKVYFAEIICLFYHHKHSNVDVA